MTTHYIPAQPGTYMVSTVYCAPDPDELIAEPVLFWCYNTEEGPIPYGFAGTMDGYLAFIFDGKVVNGEGLIVANSLEDYAAKLGLPISPPNPVDRHPRAPKDWLE